MDQALTLVTSFSFPSAERRQSPGGSSAVLECLAFSNIPGARLTESFLDPSTQWRDLFNARRSGCGKGTKQCSGGWLQSS